LILGGPARQDRGHADQRLALGIALVAGAIAGHAFGPVLDFVHQGDLAGIQIFELVGGETGP